MKAINRIKLSCFLLALGTVGQAQNSPFHYQRELTGVTQQWHKVILPEDLYEKVSSDLSDIRILGITKSNDTLEVPYIMQSTAGESIVSEIDFRLLNQSANENGYYFTFETPTESPINEITPTFRQSNFDWKASLAGSHNQKEWFSVAEDIRILALKNNLADYQFTRLTFPESKYRYYRLQIKSKEKPVLLSAKIRLQRSMKGEYTFPPIRTIQKEEDKQQKQTVIQLGLKQPTPVCGLTLDIHNPADYFRSITIEYVADSFKTEKGWKYHYALLMTGTLSSMEKSEWTFPGHILQKLKITIQNQDNAPLKIDSIQVKGFQYVLIGRFTEPARHFLAYGNKQAEMPHYDIEKFKDKIPGSLSPLLLGNERVIHPKPQKTEALFQNKIWLWGIMMVIILVLGGFTMGMMRKR